MPRLACLAALLLSACVSTHESAAPAAPEFAGMRHLEGPGVHHLIQASPRIYSGAAPEGAATFAALAELGITTIVSVDGAVPDVDGARAHGIRYVHVPFGYDGVPQDAALQIARVMRESAGPVYFHCHHGQHRGPAAAAIALRIETGCAGPEAAELMRFAETDPKYAGLWRDIEAFAPPAPGAALPELHEIAPVGDFAAGMAKMDREWDRVRAVRAASWQAPADHPDLAPAKEARILAETLAALGGRIPEEHGADAEFARMMKESQEAARALQAALEAGDAAAAEERFLALKRGCAACHDAYRN